MKKRIIAIPLALGVAGAAYAGTSHLAGSQAQDQYEKLLHSVNTAQSRVVLSNEKYTSGLLTSTAVTKVTIARVNKGDIVFNLFHDIEHGALRSTDDDVKFASVSVKTTLQDPQQLPAEVLAALTDDIPFEIRSDIEYDGEINSVVRISGVDATENSTTMAWSGLTANLVTKDATTVADGSLGSLMVNDQSDGTVINLDDSAFALDLQDNGDSIYTGTFDARLDGFSLQTPALPALISIDNATVSSNSSIEDDAINSKTVFGIDGIDAPIPLDSISFEAQYNDLLLAGMHEYGALMSNVSATDAARDDEFAGKLVTAVRNMMQPGSGSQLQLKLANSDGEVDVDLGLGLKDASASGMSDEALDNIVTGRDLLNLVAFTANLDADRAALAQTPIPTMLGVAGDYITVDEDSITSRVNLEGANLNINGVVMPLDVLAGGMLDVPLADLM